MVSGFWFLVSGSSFLVCDLLSDRARLKWFLVSGF